jgi:predicted RND superfamily exporter protein
MISDDMIGFVKNDIFVYGTTLTLILIVILWIIFREFIWVFMPLLISILSIITTSALIVLFNWNVTIVSSNFVSLQLIITLSIILHLIVRYREIALLEPKFSKAQVILSTITSKAKPSFFAIATTVVGFASLIFSGIKPVLYLGLMMSLGISVSLVVSFILFGAIMMLVSKKVPKTKEHKNKNFSFMHHVIVSVERRKKSIIGITFIIIIFSLSGAPKLLVENSFINYFKSTTEIYKSLKTIDQKLGGTTPLDVVITFKKDKSPVKSVSKPDTLDTGDSFDSFEEEYEGDANDPKYWFTPSKMQTVQKVHDYLEANRYIGSVQSLATLLKIGKILKKGKEFDSFDMALVYKKLPENFKKILLTPYVNISKNELRITTRIIDSDKSLRRDALIKKINKDLSKIVNPKIASYKLGNLMILYNNVLQSLYHSQILTMGITLIALFVMFILLFNSVKIALIAIFSNVIPIGVVFGIMGWGEIPLDMMTITIASISMGIGVDDTIHYIHRFKEEFKKDKNYIKAMRRSHESIGYAMFYTTLAIVLGFSILVTSNFIPTIYFGLLTVIVMFIALLCALLLLPMLIIKFKPLR